jgi:hypothetical protein
MVPGHGQRSTSPPPKEPVETLSNEDTMKQVIEPARQIVKTAGLQGVFAGFSYEACNDQGEPPYRGRIDASFEIPKDVEPQKYVDQVAKTMVQHGWIDGPPPGNRAFGTLIHTPEVWVILSPHPVAKEDGALRVFGQCRNMVNHREDPEKDFDVTARVVN